MVLLIKILSVLFTLLRPTRCIGTRAFVLMQPRPSPPKKKKLKKKHKKNLQKTTQQQPNSTSYLTTVSIINVFLRIIFA